MFFKLVPLAFFLTRFVLFFYSSVFNAWHVTDYFNRFLLNKTFILKVLAPSFLPQSCPCEFTRQINLIEKQMLENTEESSFFVGKGLGLHLTVSWRTLVHFQFLRLDYGRSNESGTNAERSPKWERAGDIIRCRGKMAHLDFFNTCLVAPGCLAVVWCFQDSPETFHFTRRSLYYAASFSPCTHSPRMMLFNTKMCRCISSLCSSPPPPSCLTPGPLCEPTEAHRHYWPVVRRKSIVNSILQPACDMY